MVEDPCFLDIFPEELSLKVFEFCDIPSLGRLATTCKTVKRMMYTEDSIWHEKSRFVIGSNMTERSMQRRCQPIFSCRERCKISKRWERGLGTNRTILKFKRCMPWLCLEKNHLFCSREELLVQLNRDSKGHALGKFSNTISTSEVDDIAKFAVNDVEIVTGGRDGILARWSKLDQRCIHSVKCHSSDIYCLDVKGDIIISGSRDQSIKIFKANPDDTVCQKTIEMQMRILSTAIMPSHRYFIAGLPGINQIHPLQLFDLERGEHVTNFGETFQTGAGILDIYPECDNTFLTCGYDTFVRLWDIRCPEKCVKEWVEPYDNGLYCVTSDHNVTILTGAYRNGLIHIWDKRLSKNYKAYHIANLNSPVYSIAFDAAHIFAAFDKSVREFTYI